MSKGKRESLKYKLAFLQYNCVDLIVSNANYPIDLSIFLHSSYEYCQALITHCFIHTKPKSRLGLLLCLGSRTVRLRWFLSFFPLPFQLFYPRAVCLHSKKVGFSLWRGILLCLTLLELGHVPLEVCSFHSY